MMRSCSARELLDDLSRIPSFHKNKELAKVYSDLASSLIKTAASYDPKVTALDGFYKANNDNGLLPIVAINPSELNALNKIIDDFLKSSITIDPLLAETMGRFAFYIRNAKRLEAEAADPAKSAEWNNVITMYSNCLNIIDRSTISAVKDKIINKYKTVSDPREINAIFRASQSGSSLSYDSMPLYKQFRPLVEQYFNNYPHPLFKNWFNNHKSEGVIEDSIESFGVFRSQVEACYKKQCDTSLWKQVTDWWNKPKSQQQQQQQSANQVQQPQQPTPAPTNQPKQNTPQTPNLRFNAPPPPAAVAAPAAPATQAAPTAASAFKKKVFSQTFTKEDQICQELENFKSTNPNACDMTKKFLYKDFPSQIKETNLPLGQAKSIVDLGFSISRTGGVQVDTTIPGQKENIEVTGSYPVAARYMAKQYLYTDGINHNTKLYVSMIVLAILARKIQV